MKASMEGRLMNNENQAGREVETRESPQTFAERLIAAMNKRCIAVRDGEIIELGTARKEAAQ
jgi:hypothetical protein